MSNDKDKIIKLLEEKIDKLEMELIEAKQNKYIPVIPITPINPTPWWQQPLYISYSASAGGAL